MPVQVSEEGLAPDSKVPSAHLMNPPAAVAFIDLKETTFAHSLEDIVRDLLPDSKNNAIDPTVPAKTYDGFILGDGGLYYSAETPLRNVKLILPEGGVALDTGVINIFVNGACTSPKIALREAQAVANTFGIPTLCHYNATEGQVQDVLQVVSDKCNLHNNLAVKNLRTILRNAREAQIPIRLHGDSHGGAIIAEAIESEKAELRKNLSEDECKKAVRYIAVTTGAASHSFPDGPLWEHYVCNQDIVPFQLGIAIHGLTKDEITAAAKIVKNPGWVRYVSNQLGDFTLANLGAIHPGEGAKILRFDAPQSADWFDAHRIETYLSHCKSIENSKHPLQVNSR